ncbi:MAG: S-layer domain protein [Pedosphaera sp.]|nr:S-layer domain protein [Pedosphaera sp.]
MRYFSNWMACILILLGGYSQTGCRPAKPKLVDYSTASEASVVLGKANRGNGLSQAISTGDGRTTTASVGGRDCQSLKLIDGHEQYIYFIIDPSFKSTPCSDVTVTVEYFDATQGSFDLEYDGPTGPYSGVHKKEWQKGTRTWQRAEFKLRQTRFANSQNNLADFRLRVWTPEFFANKVTLTRD